MIGTISPLVQEARGQGWRSVTIHLIGSIVGGSLVFGTLGFLGASTLHSVPVALRLAGAIVVTVALMIHDARLVQWNMPMVRRSVPRTWWLTLGPNRGAFAYGVVLGMGVTTFIPVGSFYAALVWTILNANISYGLMLGIAYGTGRALPVVGTSAALAFQPDKRAARATAARLANTINRHEGHVSVINGIALAFCCAVMIISLAV